MSWLSECLSVVWLVEVSGAVSGAVSVGHVSEKIDLLLSQVVSVELYSYLCYLLIINWL